MRKYIISNVEKKILKQYKCIKIKYKLYKKIALKK